MTTIRKIVTSKVDGNSADSTSTNEIRPFGEIAVYLNTEPNPDKLTLMMFDGTRTHLKSMVLAPGRLYGSDADSGDGRNRDTIKLIPDASLSDYTGNDQYLIVDPTDGNIHIRAGGTIDNSDADLYLGGKQTFVRVSDDSDNVAIRTGLNASIENVAVDVVDEWVPPGGVWRMFFLDADYPALGTTVQVGDTVTTSWGTPITAAITNIVQDIGEGTWALHVDQDITAEFNFGDTVTFNRGPEVLLITTRLSKTWTFDSNGSLQIPGGIIGNNDINITVVNDDSSSYTWNFGQTGVLTAPGTAIFNGTNGIVVDNLNAGIAGLFNDGDVYITGGNSVRFTGISEFDGNSTSALRFWNAEGRHSSGNDPTELVTLDVGNDATDGDPTEGFLKIITEKETGSNKEWKFDANGVLQLPVGGDIVDSEGNSVLGLVDNNIWVQTFETASPATDVPAVAVSVEYDSAGNIIALFSHVNPDNGSTYYSVGKYTTTGTRIWTARFDDEFYTDGWGLAVDNEGGFIYIAGQTVVDGGQDNTTLTKISGTIGLVEWSKIYDFGYNSSSPVVDVNSEGDPVMVGFAENGDDRYVATTKVDQTDGSIIWSRGLDGQGDEQAYGMAVGPTGEVVAIGYIDQLDDSTTYSVTPLVGSGVNVLVINRSDLNGAVFADTAEIAGTGITGTIGVNAINVYTGLTGTVQEGSGAVFEIGDNGLGAYTAAGIQNDGTNYLPGHKILVLGTDLGGATPDNDCVITVDSISEGGLIFNWSVTGTAAGAEPTVHSPVTGTNYQTGSGLTFDLELDSGSTYTEHPFNITAAGTNYVTGDVVIISGALLGGTSPANDLTTTVSTDAGGVTTFNTFTGTQQTTTYRVRTDDEGIDFSGVGTWTLSNVETDTDDRMLVVKYAANGTIAWQKAIQFDENFDCSGADADIDSEGNIYVCGQYGADNVDPIGKLMSIVKFNSSGVKQWSRRIVGNCGAFTSSIVVGADDHLYLSGTTFAGTENTVTDIHLVLAKYDFDGLVEWQRLLDYTAGFSFGIDFFGADIGGSNLAVKQDYVAVGLGFCGEEDLFGDPGSFNAAVAQIPASGDVFTVGSWDFTAASFSGTVNSTASDIVVTDANKTDYDNIANISTSTVTLFEESSNFLIGTVYTVPSRDNSLVNGAYIVTLENTGTLTLPAGGTITEGYVTSNPTIQLTPAAPTVASQKLVIKGGGGYVNIENGITVAVDHILRTEGSTITVYVESVDNADQTLYWWTYPASANGGVGGTVALDEFGDGTFSFTVDNADYEFRVRVSPEEDNYGPGVIGAQSVLINGDDPTFEGDHHLHLTTGDLSETSIILGTDDHNVRTTTDGGISMTTTRGTVLFGNTPECVPTLLTHFHIMKDDPANVDLFLGDDNNYVKLPGSGETAYGVEIGTNVGDANIWRFGTDGSLTVPGDIRSEGNINIDINLSDSTLRRWQFGEDGDTVFPNNVSINYGGGNNIQFPRIIADSGKAFSVQGQGTSGSAALAWTVDPDAAGQYAAVSVSRAGGDNLAKVILQAQSDSGDAATVKLWKFDETGTLTLPKASKVSEVTPATGPVPGIYPTPGISSIPNEDFVTTPPPAVNNYTIPGTDIVINMTFGANGPNYYGPTATIVNGGTGHTTGESLMIPYADLGIDLSGDWEWFVNAIASNLVLEAGTKDWTFAADGALTFPDASVQTTAFVQGEQVFTLDTGAIDYAPTVVDFNLLFVTPAIGYSEIDPTSVTLPNGVPGQRLVIFNGYSLATLTVNPGLLGRDISSGVVAEFIYSGFDGLWIPLYGTNSPT